jgi:SAM-dependent methyltransferase
MVVQILPEMFCCIAVTWRQTRHAARELSDMHGPETSPPSPWIVRHLPRASAGETLLDLAAGRGRHARLGLALGYSVTAVDIDIEPLADLAGQAGVSVLQADLEGGDWPLADRRFDRVVVTNYLWRPLFPALVRCVAPGGLLLYETFARGNEVLGRPRNPDFLLRRNELIDHVRPELDVVAFEDVSEAEPTPAVRQRIVARRRGPVDANQPG